MMFFSQVMPRPDVLDFDGFVLRRGAANRAPVRPPDLRQASGTTKSDEQKWEISWKDMKDYRTTESVYQAQEMNLLKYEAQFYILLSFEVAS